MDTKRCLSCHKLLRADAPKCGLCGYVFSQAPVKQNSKDTNGSDRLAIASVPSNSPASRHRAGHYSGLHPEDQPYQSSFMPIMRPAAITRRLVEHESVEVFQPVVASTSQITPVPDRGQTPKRHVASPVPSPLPMPQRYSGTLSPMAISVPLLEVETLPLPSESTLHAQNTAPLPIPAYLPGKRQPRRNIVRILLLASCLSFLMATGILAYGLHVGTAGVPMHPTMQVDHNRHQQGRSIAPTLQLPASQIDFGANVQGAISTKTITLTNMGKGQIAWQAGSNSSWLTISPIGDTFTSSEITHLKVNRTNMEPGDHTGYITFIQQGNMSKTLKVTMSVNPLAATATVAPPPPPTLTIGPSPLPAMVLTTNALAFSTIQGTDPTPQHFTITNPGNAPLDWTSTKDSNISSLISISPLNGTIAAGNRTIVTVTPNVVGAKAGVIPGRITLSATDTGTSIQNQSVSVTITIHNQAVISISTTNLTFISTAEAPTQLAITNAGSATLNWTLSSLPSWLLVDIPGGTLAPGQSAFINLTPDSTGLSAGTYTGTLVVGDTSPQAPAAPQSIKLTLTVK